MTSDNSHIELGIPAGDDEFPGELPEVIVPIEAPPAAAPVESVESEFAAYLDGEPEFDEALIERREHRVTAVLVCHDGARWLPAVLTALARSTRRPEQIIAVDSGSTDGTAELLASALDAGLLDHIVEVPRAAAFGAAVAAGIAGAAPAGSASWSGSNGGRGSSALPAAVDSTDGPADESITSGQVDLPDESDAGSEQPEVVDWVWLLHDDSAPTRGALAALLLASDITLSAQIIGPKLRGWHNQDQLVAAGLTIARSGSLVTGLERRELDQGQHDGTRDVLAVSSAGMLVQRSVWNALDGFDPALPFFRDDIDFCWRAHRAGYGVIVTSDSVIHHREAATHGRRTVEAGNPKHPERPGRIDRTAAIHLLRAHSAGRARPFVTGRLLIGSLVRALVLLLGKAPDQARDEWGAFRDAVRDRSALIASRGRIDAAAALPGGVPAADLNYLLASQRVQARHAWEGFVDAVAGRGTDDVSRSVLDSTPDDPDGWYADDRRPSRLRRFMARPATLLTLVLLLIALIGERALFGDGVLVGGALVPAPDGFGDLWSAYLAPWHEVGTGSSVDAPAWLIPLMGLSALLRGSASAAVDVILMLAVPLTGLSAYTALRGVTSTTWARVWAAVAYASLPAVTGALSGGRIGSAVAIALLPWLARVLAPVLGWGRPASWRRVFASALLLAVVASFTPVLWLVVAALAVVASVVTVREFRARGRLLLVVLLPIALAVPWSLRLVRNPALLWLEPGLTGPTDSHLTALDVVLLRPGGPGSSPIWLALGIVVTALAALVIPGPRRGIVALWLVALSGLTFAIAQLVLRVSPDSLATPLAPWPGPTTALWGGALIVAGAMAAERVPALLAGANFGWRQPVVALLAALLLLAPGFSLALLAIGADGPLSRGSREVLPAFVAADILTDSRPRAVVLKRERDVVVYDLLAAPAPQLGDIDVAPPVADSREITRIIARLAAGVGANEVDDLATHGIRYVVVSDASRHDALVDTLDSERGLRRLSARDGEALWQVVPTSSRAQVLAPVDAAQAGRADAHVATSLPTLGGDPRTPTELSTKTKTGPAGRQLLLAESIDNRWRWTLGGVAVVPQPALIAGTTDETDPSIQLAPLPAGAVSTEVAFDGSSRSGWLTLQAIVCAIVVLLALPSRRSDVDDDADTFGADDESDVAVDPLGAGNAVVIAGEVGLA